MERKKKIIVAVGENSDAKQTICRQLQKNHHIIVPCCAKPEEYQEAIEYAVHEYGGIDAMSWMKIWMARFSAVRVWQSR